MPVTVMTAARWQGLVTVIISLQVTILRSRTNFKFYFPMVEQKETIDGVRLDQQGAVRIADLQISGCLSRMTG